MGQRKLSPVRPVATVVCSVYMATPTRVPAATARHGTHAPVDYSKNNNDTYTIHSHTQIQTPGSY
ncbi:hypothetical protein EE612_056205 [Oryza sativa]|nr:hypothetical protein EE612_056205 [Oryza sativa]